MSADPVALVEYSTALARLADPPPSGHVASAAGPAAAAAVTAAASIPPTPTAPSVSVVCGAATRLRSWNGKKLNQQSLLSLPSVFDIHRLIQTPPARCFIEAFAGSASFTLGVIMAFIPCLCPWEIEFDSRLDVVRNINHLLLVIEM